MYINVHISLDNLLSIVMVELLPRKSRTKAHETIISSNIKIRTQFIAVVFVSVVPLVTLFVVSGRGRLLKLSPSCCHYKQLTHVW